MGNATIVNVSRRPYLETVMDIGIIYGTPPSGVKRALEILNEVYRNNPMAHDVIISFNKFNDFSLNLQVVHWWRNAVQRDYLAGMQGMNLQVKERFDLEGIGFAFPTQTLYLKEPALRVA